MFLKKIQINFNWKLYLEQFSLFYSIKDNELISHEDITHLQEVWNFIDRKRKNKINIIQLKIFLRLLKGKFKLDLLKQNFLFKCIVFEIDKFTKNAVTFQVCLNNLI